MVCPLFDAKPLPEVMPIYCERISTKFLKNVSICIQENAFEFDLRETTAFKSL